MGQSSPEDPQDKHDRQDDHEQRDAQVDAPDKDQQTPLLLWAAKNGREKIAQLLIESGAQVDGPDKDQQTPLIWAAENDKYQVVQLLIEAGASINLATNGKHTALMIAAQNGHNSIVRSLLDHGSIIDATNDKRQTALMLAASEGHMEVLRTLLSAKASIETSDANDETAMMYAIDSNHQDIVLELLSAKDGINQTMDLLKLGLHKRRQDAVAKKRASEEAKAEVKLADLVRLCSKMHEAQTISERIYSRLLDVEQQLSTLNEITKQEAIPRFKQLVNKTHGFLLKHGDKHAVTRLVGSHIIVSTSSDLNRELDAFLLQFDIQSDKMDLSNWEKQWDADCITMKSLMKHTLDKKDELAIELQDFQVQREALTLLMFECDHHASQYTEAEMALINRIFQDVSSMSQLKIDAVPEWFVPPHEVEFNADKWFARGSYGSVHHGTWNGTAVVIKSAFLEDEKSHGMFLGEAEIWIKLQHPHIVRLFKACHVGNPFFVCEWASNGTLPDYLCRDNIRFDTWAKLHEAAQGLRYLHSTMKVVHGDLKCKNILISADGTAKLTDFGLRFVLGSEQPTVDEVGAISWKAPEVIDGKTRGTFASDVYSLECASLKP